MLIDGLSVDGGGLDVEVDRRLHVLGLARLGRGEDAVAGLQLAAGDALDLKLERALEAAGSHGRARVESARVQGVALGIGQETPASAADKWSLFSALCIHKIPEGLALGSLLIGAGLKRPAALGWVASVEATTLLGGALGFFFLTNMSQFWLAVILAHVGGGFLFLAAHAVLGEMLKHGKGLVLTSFAIGVALIAVLKFSLQLLA